MLNLTVANLGPIVHGSISLKPLTILIGPNNSGKSYAATLLYSVFRPRWPVLRSPGFSTNYLSAPFGPGLPYSRSLTTAIRVAPTDFAALTESSRNFAAELFNLETLPSSVVFRDMPNDLQDFVHQMVGRVAESYVSGLQAEIQRCFATSVSHIRREGTRLDAFKVTISESTPNWQIDIGLSRERLVCQTVEVDYDNLHTTRADMKPARRIVSSRAEDETDEAAIFSLTGAFLSRIFRPLARNTYYLPAARSGILQNYRALAGFMVALSNLAGIEEVSIPRFAGSVLDFINFLISLDRNRTGPLADVADFLESDVIRGQISLASDRNETPDIEYHPARGKMSLPLNQTSSMVSELAPLILLVRHALFRHDILIIEEPESHLHPASQRKIAEAIVQLVHSGVNVVVTTHSDYFVSQIGNFIRLAKIDPNEREELGHLPTSYISADDVSALLFHHGNRPFGTSIKCLAVNEDEGISVDSFSEVAASLYDESTRLQYWLME
jgi:hypothetical protein